MMLFRLLSCVFAIVATAACADAHRIDVTTVLSHGNCRTDTVGVTEIDYATLATFRGAHLIGMTQSAEAIRNPVHLVAIAPGQFPTAGYAVVLNGEPSLDGHLLTVRVKIDRPPADAVLAQMLTRPCLVVGVADQTVRSVRAIDDAQREIGEVVLSPSTK